MKNVTTMVYEFDELSESAKEKALAEFSDINTEYDWWNFTLDDALNIGVKIEEFDTYHGIIQGRLTMSMLESITEIINNHGVETDTYKVAIEYLEKYKSLKDDKDVIDLVKMDDMDIEEAIAEIAIEKIEAGYEHDLLEEYLSYLKKEEEYLRSAEAIIETIKANEYQFTEDGKVF
jgi:hypothetical protein